jgi:hypothetical protein
MGVDDQPRPVSRPVRELLSVLLSPSRDRNPLPAVAEIVRIVSLDARLKEAGDVSRPRQQEGTTIQPK